MKMPASWSIAAAAMLLVTASVHAADAVPAPAPGRVVDQAGEQASNQADAKASADSEAITAADRAAEKAANEPNVKRTVIDDSHARIEELRVRGQLQKVTVRPKDGAPGYEIIIGSGSPEQAFSAGQAGSRGSSGKRVWNLLQF